MVERTAIMRGVFEERCCLPGTRELRVITKCGDCVASLSVSGRCMDDRIIADLFSFLERHDPSGATLRLL